jgi:hypothetical protein
MTFTETDPVTLAFNEHQAAGAPDAFFAAFVTDQQWLGISDSLFGGNGKNRRI